MALTSIGRDFVTQRGVTIEGTGTVTSSTGQTNVLQAYSGAAIAKNLIVGSTATVWGPTNLNNTLAVGGQSTFNEVTATVFSATSITVTGQSTFNEVTATVFSATSVTVTGKTLVNIFTATNATTDYLTVNTQLDVLGQSNLNGLLASHSTMTSLTVSAVASVAGILYATQGTDPTGASNGTGAFQVNGGAAISGQLYVGGTTYLGGDLYVDGTQFAVNSTSIATGDKTIVLSTASTNAALAAGSGLLIGSTDTNVAYAYLLYDGTTSTGYWYTANGIKINATTDANSTNTGALQVAGGIGVAGGIFVAGVVTASNFIGYLGGPGAGAIGSGANLYGGTTGALVYQSAPNTTAFLSSGTNGQLLYMSGGVPTWQSPSSLSAGNATTSSNIAGGLQDQIPFQSAPGQTTFNVGLVYNGTTFTTTNIQVTSNNNATSSTGNSGALMVTGGVGISKDLWVAGNINVGGNIYMDGVGLDTIQGTTATFVQVNVTGTGYALLVPNGSVSIGQNLTATTVVISSTNFSTSTAASNALYVAGGVGIDNTLKVTGDTWIGGSLNVSGNITGTNVTINNLTGTNAQFYGDATGNGALYAGVLGYTPFGQTMFQATGNYNDYMEINVQNINTGTKATADIVVSADNVSSNSAYIDMGITNSNWDGTQPNSLGTVLGPNDGYIMVGQNTVTADHRGDLVFGTTTTSSQIKFVVAATTLPATTASVALVINPVGSDAISTTTGVVVAYGGIAATSAYIGGTVTSTAHVIYGDTAANSTNSGALQVAGGAGIGGGLVVGGTTTATNAYISNNLTASTITGTNIEAGNAGFGSVYLTQYASVFAAGGASVSNVLLQASANNLTGGGIGIATIGGGQSLYSSGAINFTTNRTLRDRDTPQGGNTFMSLSTSGVLTLSGTVSSNSTTTGALTVAGGVGIGGGLVVGGIVTATTFVGALTGLATTATLAYNATTATNVAGGAAGSIPIQISSGVTGFIPLGTSGYVLTAGSTTATWTALSGVTAGSATTASNIAGFAAQQILFQYSPGITTASSGLAYNLNLNQFTTTNILAYGITTSTGQLIANSGVVSQGTNTGALVVYGGAGVTGAVSAGGIVYAGLQSAATNAPILTFSGGNTTFATYTSNSLTGAGQVTLDSWSTSSYRTARYVVQIEDSRKIHVTEMTVFTNWSSVYVNQYGISTTDGELGEFDANLVAGNVVLYFTPVAASAMTIKMSRLTITS